MASTDPRKTSVAVVGAGLAGLLAAQGLKMRGFDVVVFEKDASLDACTRNWTILMHWAMPLLSKLLPEEILDDMPSALCNPHMSVDEFSESLPAFDSTNGDFLFRKPIPGARRVNHQAFRAVLVKGLNIRWGARLLRLEDRGEPSSGPGSGGRRIALEVEGAEPSEADFVLGTDGMLSKVREFLVGEQEAKPQGSGFIMASANNTLGDAAKVDEVIGVHPVAALMLGENAAGAHGVLSAPDPDDKTTWTVFWNKIWSGDPVSFRGPDALEYISKHTTPLRGTFQSIIDWTPNSAEVGVDEMRHWIPRAWDNHGGRVTLAGDAAHSMLPFRGQGFQNAIIDVSSYVDALEQCRESNLDESSTTRVMAAYDDEVIFRGAQAVDQSLQEARKSLKV